MRAAIALIAALREGLAGAADATRAPGMQAYMKSTMPYYGVAAVPRRAVQKTIFAAHPLPDEATWRQAVMTLWRKARFREERYAAIDLTGHKLYRTYQTPALMDLYEELIVDGAWWDYVDEVATHRVGPLLRSHPKPMKKLLLLWSTDDNLWRRRTAIIAQVGAGDEIDLELLYRAIAPSLASKEFFLRKAIGWALRQHAWRDPKEIKRYVEENRAKLSGLSIREALKNV